MSISILSKIFSSVVEGTVIFNTVDGPDSGAVIGIGVQKPGNFHDLLPTFYSTSLTASLGSGDTSFLIPPKRTSTSEALAMTQAAIKKLVADSVSASLEAQAANMANNDNTTRPREAPIARQCSYKEFMSCQPINFKGSEGAKTEDEFYHLTVKGNDLKAYVRRFQELATLCPTMVSDSEKMMEVFIGGLPRSIEGKVTASKPQTL
ncbi:reverse transcriptase domain-containing protein [Tanacetum coccineum]|uniref:Reverse transcriptase domain-containing protein n=1 Tax=Tanacetum coccineum TaxID=301880 RepID=A0ABQ5I2F0_9ASTR